jgi:hypothetical protein
VINAHLKRLVALKTADDKGIQASIVQGWTSRVSETKG